MQALPPILGQQCRPDNIVVAFFPLTSPPHSERREEKEKDGDVLVAGEDKGSPVY